MNRLAVCLAAFALALAIGGVPRAESRMSAGSQRTGILAYSVPAQPTSADYSVRARVAGRPWQPVRAVAVNVDLHTRSRATLVTFDASTAVEVSLTKRSGTISSARVRPASLGVVAVISQDRKTATFRLSPPANVSFEVDGDILHDVHLFVHKPGHRPSGKRRLVFFGAGVHVLPGAHVLHVGSNTTVYLAPGALVRGSIEVARAHNVVISGHGAIDPTPFVQPGQRATIYVHDSSDVGIRDVTILDGQDGAITTTDSRRVVIAGVGEINVDRFSDGVDVMSTADLLIDGVFLRTSDDSINVSASTPWGGHGSTRNVTVRNSSLWADAAHPVLVGVGGNPNAHDKVERIVFQNIDVLEHDEANSLYQGALAIDAGDHVTVRNVRFQDIRISPFTRGTLVNVRVFKNDSYNKAAGDGVDGVLFRDIVYTGSGELASRIDGFDRGRTVDGVVFENLTLRGSLALSPRAANISVGPFVAGLLFRAKPATVATSVLSRAVRRSRTWVRNGSTVVAHRPASLAFSFNGSEARVLGALGPAAGVFQVFLDGKAAGRVDCFALRRASGQILFDTGLLSRGSHRLVLRALGTHDVLATGSSVTVRGFEHVP
ncbi:MAG: glycosyl hydrolase family 28 protein [Gaiellaceae bacterium]